MSANMRFRHVTKYFQRPGDVAPQAVLENFSLDVAPGELVALVGASGIGKTTLLHLAAGLEWSDEGEVEIAASGRAARIGMVFQQPRLFEWLTVGRNIDIAAEAAGIDGRIGRQEDDVIDDTVSFADAAKVDVRGPTAGHAAYRRVTGCRVHVLADGAWRSYAVSQLLTDHRCDHCGRPAGRLDRVIRYGKKGRLTCCLRCVEWHDEFSCPHVSMARHP